MALTTTEDRMSFPQFTPLFAKGLIGERTLVREGRLVEFVSASAAAASVATNKKKNLLPPPPPKEYRLIVTSDMIYMCEIVSSPLVHEPKSSSKKSSESKGSLVSGGSVLSLPASVHHKQLRLCHESVLVMDAQISSTPDVIHPPVIQKDMVMVYFYNDTTYILQAECSEVQDAWVECARALNIEQPKPSVACREQDEQVELQRSGSTITLGGAFGGSIVSFKGMSGSSAGGSSKGGKVSLLKRLKSLRWSTANLHAEDNGSIPEIHPDQLTLNDEEERARRMQLGQPSLWEVRHLPLDLGVIPPLEQPIPFWKRHPYDISVQIEDLTTGKTEPGEFGMGIKDRAAYFRDECALFAVLRPARLIPSHAIDRKRDDLFLCKKRMHRGEIHYVEPPYITDFYARSWLHPEMHTEFNPEARTVTTAKMYMITCSTTDIVGEFKKYHAWLMENARISPDNIFLCMDCRSQPPWVSKRIERAASSAPPTMSSVEETRILEGGSKYTELGECHMEFRRMSNSPDALSVGFYNPAIKRDMAIGVMVFDKIKIKATASSLGLNALGANNGVTDARTRPRFIKGQRVFETVKSKSLDVFKLVGPRDALDELEEFIHDQVLNASIADEDANVFENRRAQLQRSGSKPRSATAPSPLSREVALTSLSKKKRVRRISTLRTRKESLARSIPVTGYLATVLEEDEEDDAATGTGSLSKNSFASSTATFRPKSKKALQEMLVAQQELLASQQNFSSPSSIVSSLPQMDPSSFEDLTANGSLTGYLSFTKSITTEKEEEEMAAPTVADLTKFWAKTINALVRSGSQSTIRSVDSTISATSTLNSATHTATHSSSSSSSPSATTPALNSVESTTIKKVPESSSSSTIPAQAQPQHQPEIIESSVPNYIAPVGPPSELEARVQALKSTASHSAIVAQATEENQAQANAKDLVQATRYLPKHKIQVSSGFLHAGAGTEAGTGAGACGEVAAAAVGENEPGVDGDPHMPVKDLKKRWEEIHRLGI
ncbi:hypothetical protein BGX23_006654 [Mortierella sp. AD031]|nr:hypothetical protein BGX23_006654 [Mortierella sp. AD031]